MKAATPGRRAERVGERIKTELMQLLLRGDVRDPGAADCFITDVVVSDDLSRARVYVRLLREDVREPEQKRALAALGRAAGYLRRELAGRLEIKHQPELRFHWDDGVDRSERIERLLAEIASEGKA
jgi:ribosome-binding factor A